MGEMKQRLKNKEIGTAVGAARTILYLASVVRTKSVPKRSDRLADFEYLASHYQNIHQAFLLLHGLIVDLYDLEPFFYYVRIQGIGMDVSLAVCVFLPTDLIRQLVQSAQRILVFVDLSHARGQIR